jgi:hypothetical protein
MRMVGLSQTDEDGLFNQRQLLNLQNYACDSAALIFQLLVSDSFPCTLFLHMPHECLPEQV